MSDTKPQMRVETENVSVTVTDRRSAGIALRIVDDVLTAYLGQTTTVDRDLLRRDREKVAYDAQCPECGHEWRRKAQDDTRSTCPSCGHGWTHSVRGREREDAEVVA